MDLHQGDFINALHYSDRPGAISNGRICSQAIPSSSNIINDVVRQWITVEIILHYDGKGGRTTGNDGREDFRIMRRRKGQRVKEI